MLYYIEVVFEFMAKEKKETNSKNKKQESDGFFQNMKYPNINPFTWIIIGIVVWSLISFFYSPLAQQEDKNVSINEVISLVRQEQVEKVIIDGDNLEIELKSGEIVKSSKEPTLSFFELLSMQGVDPDLVVGGIYEEQSLPWIEIVASLILPAATLFIIFWFFRQAGRSSGGLFNIGKSKARLFTRGEKNQIGFEDVAGAKEIKRELEEIVDFLKRPEKYRKLGARIPRGILLIGPSGVGKTLLARAIAGEANVPFYSVAGSEFIEMIVGVGSARVRDLFKTAKETSPSLIFIDEIDAIGRHRGKSMAMSNDEREQTLNQILVEMDGFDSRTNVIIIAATNRPDMLDPALVRPGRFDRHIRLELPDVEERMGIIQIHMKGKPFSPAVDIERLARQTVGFSGADIENMLNEAAILAARRNSNEIEQVDLTEASTKVKLGPGRKLLQTEDERKVVAYHEAGHALVSALNPEADPVTRISIISRTMSLGHTEFLPRSEMVNQTKNKLIAQIQSLLGGRAAEETVFGEETVGAASDIERATLIARKMVTDFGMSDLGPINLVSDNSGIWDITAQNKAVGYSEKTAQDIDNEVMRIIRTQYTRALEILKNNRKTLDMIADELLKRETLEQDEFEEIISNKASSSET